MQTIVLLVLENLKKIFLIKLKMVEEELDETAHWLELIMDSGLIKKERLVELHLENLELLKIITRSIITMREKINKL